MATAGSLITADSNRRDSPADALLYDQVTTVACISVAPGSPSVRSDGDSPGLKRPCELSIDSRLNDTALQTPPQAELVEETGSWLGTGRILYAEPHSLRTRFSIFWSHRSYSS